jgi:hypothetical protein
MAVMVRTADSTRTLRHVADGSMLLKKSFWGYEQIFTEALVRRSENDVGGT